MTKCGFYERFKESIIVNTKRVYDSCATKDYLENLRCYFTETNQSIIEQSVNIKVRTASIIDVEVNIEPISFRKGFFSIEQNFYFDIGIEASLVKSSNNLNALCIFSKNMTMFGSDSSTKIYSSDKNFSEQNQNNIPTAVVQVSNPIILSSSLNDVTYAEDLGKVPVIPDYIINYFGGNLVYLNVSKYVNVTMGLFAITHVERSVQMLIPSYDFGRPVKECNNGINSREEFDNMNFPLDNFFPPLGSFCISSVNKN
ncbi:MAG: hypothetical protein J6P21_00880 [Clostridia bacterium]|nr:hypothetical protein [Clostridia bacterium]